MAIFVDGGTRVLCQGLTGWAGSHHATRMIEYGTKIVAGVTPAKGGQTHLRIPIFNDVKAAVAATKANASIVFVPPAHAADAMVEAIEAEIPLVVAVTERIPILDMVRVRDALQGSRTKLIGPNSQGLLAPGLCKIGVMATGGERPGRVGVVSRSASLTSEIVAQITAAGLGQSTTVGVGGDPIHGVGFVECLEMFFADPDTDGVVMIGEIGGREEEQAAEFLAKADKRKPVVGLVVGRHAPPERRMGHAGTLTTGKGGDAASKIAALEAAGAIMAAGAHMVGETIKKAVAPASKR